LAFAENVKSELRNRAMHRTVENASGAYALRERGETYNSDFGCKSEALSIENSVSWNESFAASDAWSEAGLSRTSG